MAEVTEVVGIIAETLNKTESEIHLESNLIQDLGADSLAIVELVMALEDKFGLDQVEDEELEKIQTVNDVVDYINRATA